MVHTATSGSILRWENKYNKTYFIIYIHVTDKMEGERSIVICILQPIWPRYRCSETTDFTSRTDFKCSKSFLKTKKQGAEIILERENEEVAC